MDFLGARRAFLLGTTVHTVHIFGAHSNGDAAGVHRGVARTNHRHFLAHARRRVGLRVLVGAHQVHARQVFVGREDAVEPFARNAHEVGKACPDADERGFVSHFLHELRNGEEASNDRIGHHLDA